MSAATLILTTSDGHELDADLAIPDDSLVAAAVVCHPHPQYGGNRFNPVVDAVFRSLPAAGIAAVRFDFRSAHDGGDAERLDVVAALDAITDLGVPMFVVGYSFGALVALATDDARIAAVAAIAPPLSSSSPAPTAPALVLTPRHDQFCPPEQAASLTAEWRHVERDVIESADHFLPGHSAAVADCVRAWLLQRLGDQLAQPVN